MAMRDKIEHAIQNQPCTVKDLKNKFGGDRGADRKVMEAVDQLVHRLSSASAKACSSPCAAAVPIRHCCVRW